MYRPPYKTYRGNFNYYPMKIGDHVHIGANSVVEAAQIGNHVEIGKNCVIVGFLPDLFRHCILKQTPEGKFTIIKDCAKIADNTIVPPNTVVPALALFSGSPGLVSPPAPSCCLTLSNRSFLRGSSRIYTGNGRGSNETILYTISAFKIM
jgi:dynactin-5